MTSFKRLGQGWWQDYYTDNPTPMDARQSLHGGYDNVHRYERCPYEGQAVNFNRTGVPAAFRNRDGRRLSQELQSARLGSWAHQNAEERFFAWRLDNFFATYSIVQMGRLAGRAYDDSTLLSREERRRRGISDKSIQKLEILNEILHAYGYDGSHESMRGRLPLTRRNGTRAAEGVIFLIKSQGQGVPECFRQLRTGSLKWSYVWGILADFAKGYQVPDNVATSVESAE